MTDEGRLLRRPKTNADQDAAHTLRIGVVIFMVLLVVLPGLMN